MNKYIQQSESVEQIIAAAIRLKGGRIYQSHSHSRCIADAIANGEKGPVDCEQGFVTSTGRFVSRTEAMTIAYKAKQTYRSEGELFSEDVTYPQMKSPPHKEHGEGLEDWAKEFVKIRVKHRGEAYGGIAIAIEEYDFISQLLLSTQQEAVEKERERVKEIVTNPPKDLVVKYGDYDDLDVWSVDWQRYILDSLTPKETI